MEKTRIMRPINTKSRLVVIAGTLVLLFTAMASRYYGKHSPDGVYPQVNDLAFASSEYSLRRSLGSSQEWQQVGSDIVGKSKEERAGWSIAMSTDGKRIAVGAPWYDGSDENDGVVRVYEWDDTMRKWKQMGMEGLTHYNANQAMQGSNSDYFGKRLSMSGNGSRIAVGVPDALVLKNCSRTNEDDLPNNYDDENCLNGFFDVPNGGAVYIFEWDGSRWRVMDYFESYDEGRRLGESVSLSEDGNRLVTLQHGTAYMYEWDGDSDLWKPIGSVTVDSNSNSASISAIGDRVAVSSPSRVQVYDYQGQDQDVTHYLWTSVGDSIYHDDINVVFLSSDLNRIGVGDCPFRVYDLVDGSWVQVGPTLEDLNCVSSHVSMSRDGRRLLASRTDGYLARVYEYDGSSLKQVGSDILVGETQEESTGRALAISGTGERVAVGSPNTNGVHGLDSGIVRVFDFGNSPTASFPRNFNKVICDYSVCLDKLLDKYKGRKKFEAGQDFYDTSRRKARYAKTSIEKDAKLIKSLYLLRQAAKSIEELKMSAPGFSKVIGKFISDCAIDLTEDFINVYRDKGILEEKFLDSMRKNQLDFAKHKRSVQKWRRSIGKSRTAIELMMIKLNETTVPTC